MFSKKNLKNRDFWVTGRPSQNSEPGDASPPSSPAATPKSTGEYLGAASLIEPIRSSDGMS